MQREDLIWSTDSFGEVIKKGREHKGLTQKELGKLCENTSGMYISQIERGDRIPRLRLCSLLAKALDLDKRRLLLLAYRTNVPREIQELIVGRESTPYDEIQELIVGRESTPYDEDFRVIFQTVSGLPERKKKEVLEALKVVLRLVVDDFDREPSEQSLSK